LSETPQRQSNPNFIFKSPVASTLVACLSVACLSVCLSPDCLQPDKSEEKHCLSICRLSVCPHAAYWLWPACPSSCPLSSRCLSPACRYLYLPGANPITKIHACAESPLLGGEGKEKPFVLLARLRISYISNPACKSTIYF
jgi:hypothetical protein